jgi:hypothetical protein
LLNKEYGGVNCPKIEKLDPFLGNIGASTLLRVILILPLKSFA